MQVDVLIVGQGICGTLLSWFLHKEGKTFLVIDEENQNAASSVAAGVMNPVTGRRYVTTWMADVFFDFACSTYKDFGSCIDATLLYHKNIIDFFPTPQMRNAFVDRISENDTYLRSYPDQNHFNANFNYDFGCGEIRPVYTVGFKPLLTAWRHWLKQKNCLREDFFSVEELNVTKDGVRYNDVVAEKIIFCDGIAAANNSWFSLLPFSANKGETLIIECEDLRSDHVFKKGMMLVPLPNENRFWFGSNYQWEFENELPTESFYKSASDVLDRWLKVPYSIVDHKAAIRPATLERRPFVGFHPQQRTIGILNGMGTKGALLAPFFAHQLAQNIVYNFPITPEADVQRFSRILSK